MKTVTVLLVVVVLLVAPAAYGAPTPAPDPVPNTGHAPIVYVTYTYVVPALSKITGRVLPHWWFRCTVPARWRGHVNGTGRRHCVLFRR